MYTPVLITPPDPEAPVVTLEEAKVHLRVDGTDEDGLIGSLVAAATQHMDGYGGVLGRCLMVQTWRQDFDVFSSCLRLPFAGCAVTSITYLDTAGAQQTIDGANFDVVNDSLGSVIAFPFTFTPPTVSLTRRAAVSVTFTCGAESAADVPAPIKAAILLMVGHLYANREAVNVGNLVTTMPMAVEALIQPYRRVGI